MTLDQAIKHAEEVAKEKRYEYQECIEVHDIESATECGECEMQHRQLAEWLKDYKRLLEQEPYICDSCKHKDDGWDTEPCDGCCGNHSGYEPEAEAAKLQQAYNKGFENCRQAVLDAMSDTWKHICYVARHRKPTKGEEAVYSDMIGTVKSLPPVRLQEPCDDAISRQAVLEKAYDMSEIDGEHFTEPFMVVDVEDIQKLPSVTQKPIECDDVISRQAAIALAKDICVPIKDGTVYKHRCIDPDTIRDLPPVTPHQKSGKWIIKDRYYHDTITAECSECHREVEIPTCMEELMYDFCPYCGARMFEPQESEV